MSFTCCPLSYDDDAGPSCSSTTIRRAAKPRHCGECGEVIAKGDRYEFTSGIWDGRPNSHRTCLSCVEIRKHFACGNGWIYGALWEDMESNFFPDMRAGGPCMEGLSPAAKARLFERCLAWRMRGSS